MQLVCCHSWCKPKQITSDLRRGAMSALSRETAYCIQGEELTCTGICMASVFQKQHGNFNDTLQDLLCPFADQISKHTGDAM